MDKVRKSGSITDTSLIKSLTKDGFILPEDIINKILLEMEIMGLITVSWFAKNTRRIEIRSNQEEKDNVDVENAKTLENEYKINGPIDLIEKVLEIGKSGTQINRYKGLGEMNPEQLWETTLDKNFRSLLLVKINEVNEANIIFETLMGEVTEGRKNFIQENSLKVANLDI